MKCTLPRWLSTDPVDLRRINVNTVLGVCAYGLGWVSECVVLCIFATFWCALVSSCIYLYICAILCVKILVFLWMHVRFCQRECVVCWKCAWTMKKAIQLVQKESHTLSLSHTYPGRVKPCSALHTGFTQAPSPCLWSLNLYVSFTVILITSFSLSLHLFLQAIKGKKNDPRWHHSDSW